MTLNHRGVGQSFFFLFSSSEKKSLTEMLERVITFCLLSYFIYVVFFSLQYSLLIYFAYQYIEISSDILPIFCL